MGTILEMEVIHGTRKREENAAGDKARSPYRRNIVPAATNIIAVVSLL